MFAVGKWKLVITYNSVDTESKLLRWTLLKRQTRAIYVLLYGYRPKSVAAGLAYSLYAGSVCDDSAAKAAYAAIVALYRRTLLLPYFYRCRPSKSPRASLFLKRLPRLASGSPLHCWQPSIFGCWPSDVELPATEGYVGGISGNLPHSTRDVSVHWHSADLTFLCLHTVYSGPSILHCCVDRNVALLLSLSFDAAFTGCPLFRKV